MVIVIRKKRLQNGSEEFALFYSVDDNTQILS